jgi:hypothetical protein
MTWLLKLYPPRWRRRYGEEFRDLAGNQRFSIGNAVDLISGAIDAWIHPQFTTTVHTAAAAEGDETMNGKQMSLRCAGFGPEITRADQWKSLGVTLGATVVLTAGWMWLHVRMHDNPYVDSFSLMPMLAGWRVSMRHTYLKGRSGAAQAIFITGTVALLFLFFGVIGWITARI